jgi:hypothetical protein
MPMTITRIARERTLATLVRNLFVFEGRDAAAQAKRAETALLRANPHLADRAAFTTGAVVAIPADIALKRSDRDAARPEGIGGVLAESADRLDLVHAVAQVALKQEAAEASAYLERLRDDAFRRAVTSQAASGARILEEAQAAQKARLESADARTREIAAAVEAAQAEIRALMKRAGEG